MYFLTVRSGMAEGTSWPIENRPIIVGRESGCDVRIPDPVVSRHHCEISLVEGVIHVRDLGSLNPTFVDGKPVTSCTLRGGEEVRIGRVVFFIRQGAEDGVSEVEDLQLYSTDTLAEQESVYLSAHTAKNNVEVQPQTDADLNELFRLGRSLSRIATEADLIAAVGSAVVAHFRPDMAWLLLLRSEEEKLVEFPGPDLSPGASQPPLPRDLITSTLAEKNGMLIPKRFETAAGAAIQCTMVAPIFFGKRQIGAMAIQRRHAHRTYYKKDLHFFVALAHIVAPFFTAIERVEELEAVNKRLRLAAEKVTRIVGSSKVMARVQRMLAVVAPTMQSVLIGGATGTGKELVASLIHELSERASGPLIVVNCAAIPRDLFEAEFFGHEKGAFTGAIGRKIGLLEQSDGGTLFLDEIGDLSYEHQARILRAVETGRFRRVGGHEEISADFRVIAATNKDLGVEIQKGRFREDLYHRLRAVEIQIPPLASRRCDVPELANFFLEAACAKTKRPVKQFSAKAIEYLVNLPWPGNVRELKNTVETAVAFSQGEMIDVDDLRAIASAHDTENAPLPLAEVERLHILKALEYTEGSMTETARLLGIGRSTLYTKMTEYGLR